MAVDGSGDGMDFAYLEAFAAGDETLIVEILTIFREQADAWSSALSGPAPRDALHGLKGSARGIGATDLGDLCEAAEQGGSVAAAQEGLAAVVAAIEGYLSRVGGG